MSVFISLLFSIPNLDFRHLDWVTYSTIITVDRLIPEVKTPILQLSVCDVIYMDPLHVMLTNIFPYFHNSLLLAALSELNQHVSDRL